MSEGPKRPVNNISSSSGDGEETLTLVEVAELLRCSRAHAAMLVDAGRLAMALDREHEQRVTRASVVAYAKSRESAGDADYKRAARDAGMYQIPDQGYVEELEKKRAPNPGKRR